MGRVGGWVVRAMVIMACLNCVAASKVPSAADGSRDSAIDTGQQNMPFKNYGVAIQWEQACRGGNTQMCVKMAEAAADGLGDIEASNKVALGFYKMACEQGDGASCAKAARIALDGSALRVDPPLAKSFAERGCNALKHQDSCAVLAEVMAATGDTQGAAALADSACAAGAGEGCRQKAARLFYESDDAASQAQAIPLFTAACDAKQAWGCAGLADVYEDGKGGVAKDRAKAMAYAKSGCEQAQGSGRERACTQHGTYLTYGGDKVQINKGEQYLDASCRYGDSAACVWLGKVGLRGKQGATTTMVEGLYYERRGCDLDNGGGCAELALSYDIGNGIEADPGVAVQLYDKACRLKDAESCGKATELAAGGARNLVPAIDASQTVAEQLVAAEQMVKTGYPMEGAVTAYRLNNEGNEDAEWLLGGWMYYGLPGVFDPPRKDDGFILFENAARVGHVQAAIWVGMAYWTGQDVEVDQDKAMQYMAIAASRGSAEAEAILRSMQAEPIRQENARRQAEMEAWANRQRSDWELAMEAWDTALRSGAYSYSSSNYSTMSTGRSVSDVINDNNFNYAMDYYSGYTSVCSSSNPYC
ncbi:MAG: sel1 repeat family protein [Asticcacaulis sp.]|nr:sel1 repeat family protein [Asticcacaulis sp.]